MPDRKSEKRFDAWLAGEAARCREVGTRHWCEGGGTQAAKLLQYRLESVGFDPAGID
ncbi:hypothetical protein [Mycobacterium kubicae]|uniref:hypothetical protein n=1 Tax=Mycobacterium kubicae TaxID=120959 RepID=UPI0013F4C6B9|nr:hypothetical protein [Mycobacterium kubicae]